jgi:hypothetical protein
MCNFLSGYATEKRGLRCNHWVDSHEDQIDLFGDNDLDKQQPESGICRWELTPPRDNNQFFSLDQWTFTIDEQKPPSWADVHIVEFDARQHLIRLLDDCPDTADGIKVLDGRVLALRGKGTVSKLTDNTTLRYAGYATIKNAGDATIKYAGYATIAGVKHGKPQKQ